MCKDFASTIQHMRNILIAIWQNILEPQQPISALQFYLAVGYLPYQDDLLRCNCVEAGRVGHFDCGWSEEENKPLFMLPYETVKKIRKMQYMGSVYTVEWMSYQISEGWKRRNHPDPILKSRNRLRVKYWISLRRGVQ